MQPSRPESYSMSLVLFSIDQKVGFGKYKDTNFSSLLDWPVTRNYIRWMQDEDMIDIGYLDEADQKDILSILNNTAHEDACRWRNTHDTLCEGDMEY